MTGSPPSLSVPVGSTPPPPGAPGWASPVRPKRTGLYAGVAAVVIVAAVVVGLGFANVIPGFHLGGAGGGSGGHSTQYTVTFSETGLPAGTTWSITLGGSTQSSSGSTISFTEGNGSYSFSVGSVSGYQASPSSGTVAINGTAVTQSVTFTPRALTYTVTFTESGLGSGVSWTVTLDSTSQSSSSRSIALNGISDGAHTFAVAASGYTATPSSGTITVSGANVSQSIVFTSGGGGGSGQTSGPAEAAALSAASGYSGGGWHVVVAWAFAIPSAASWPPQIFDNFTTSGCTSTTWIGGEPASINLPATSSSASAGASAAWIILLSQSSTGSLLLTDVFSGTATLLTYSTGGSCAFYVAFSMVGTINSSQAANVANANGGAAFLSAHSDSSRLYVGIGSALPYIYAAWVISYTTCGITQTSGTGYFFNATVNGTSGQLIHSSTGTESCTGSATGAAASLLAASPSMASDPGASLRATPVGVSSRRP